MKIIALSNIWPNESITTPQRFWRARNNTKLLSMRRWRRRWWRRWWWLYNWPEITRVELQTIDETANTLYSSYRDTSQHHTHTHSQRSTFSALLAHFNSRVYASRCPPVRKDRINAMKREMNNESWIKNVEDEARGWIAENRNAFCQRDTYNVHRMY